MNEKPVGGKQESVPLPAGYTRCIELTRGFDRAAPEPVNSTNGHLLAMTNFWLFQGAFYFLIFQGDPSVQHSDAFFYSFLIFFSLAIVFSMLYAGPLFLRRWLMGLLNSVYYRIDPIIDPYRAENEKVLLALLTRKPGFLISSWRPSGLLVFTTHRCFHLRTSTITSIVNATKKPFLIDIEVCDYSYYPDFLSLDIPNTLTGNWLAKRFSIRTNISSEAEIWQLMPIDSNNFNLLDAILARRDRIEK
jgi:hypothetical protein